jgi:hypothetical protein
MTLEDVLRAAGANGRLDKLHFDKDPSGRGWQVSVPSRFGNSAWAVEINADPVVALRDALEDYAPASVPSDLDAMLE